MIGKPVGILGSWLASRPALHGPRPPISWPLLVGGGAVAGIGFTVSLLISGLAFSGERLAEAKLGVLGSAIVAPLIAWVDIPCLRACRATFARARSAAPPRIWSTSRGRRPRARPHRGPADASVTLVEYGDFECPYCGQAEPVVRELLASSDDDVRYVWRHLPLNDVHGSAQLAAEAIEAANAQGAFWDVYDAFLAHQDALAPADITKIVQGLGLDLERFWSDVRHHEYAARVAEDVASADASGVSGTPTFFINGRRHQGAYDIDTLSTAVRAARGRARLTAAASS